MNTPTALTELEQRLADPGGAALGATLAARLARLEHAARTRMDAGLPPAAFQDCLAVADAALAAREVLAQHPSQSSTDAGTPMPPSRFTSSSR
jgi:ribulose 1,5-bisphosphate synthetase/thiazole synthase